MAANVGVQRQLHSMSRGQKPNHGFTGDVWEIHIEGACAELAVAKALNVYWEPRVDTFKAVADIGRNIEVRRRSKHSYDHLIRGDDPDDRISVCVTGSIPTYHVHGWYWIGEAKKHSEWIQTHGGRPDAWFVPKAELRAITDLIDLLALDNNSLAVNAESV